MDGDLKMLLGMCFGIILLIFGICLVCSFIEVNYVENVPVVVRVNGKEVYKGPSVGVVVDSSGANTTVSIKGGFLYWFPKAYYVSSDVEMIGVKENK